MRTGEVYRWLLLSLGWLLYFSFGVISTSLAPLVAPIMGDLGITYTQMGLVTGSWQLVYIFSAQPLGRAIDRLGLRRSLFMGAAVISASSLLRGLAGGFWDLYASVALFGLGGPMISIGTPKLVATWFDGGERGLASGINISGSACGGVAALALTNSLVLPLAGGWRGVFYLYGAFGLSCAAVWLLLSGHPHPPGGGPSAGASRRGAGSSGELLRHRGVWLIVGMGVVTFLTNHGLGNWLPRMLELKGMSPAEAGYAASLMILFGILGNIAVPWLASGGGAGGVVIHLVLLFSGASVLVLELGAGPALWAGVALSGIFVRSLMPVLVLMLMEMPEVGAERLGTAAGLFFSVGQVGGFLGPFLLGFLKDLTGSFLLGILFIAALNAAATIPLALLGRRTSLRAR